MESIRREEEMDLQALEAGLLTKRRGISFKT